MNRFSLLLLSLLVPAVLFLTSCQKDETPVQSSDGESLVLDVNNDGASITAERVRYMYTPVFDTAYQSFFPMINGGFKYSPMTPATGPDHFFYLVAEVASPVRSGNRVLSATHVSVNGNRAYVTYHYNEPDGAAMSADLYEGQIDVFDITNPRVPEILKSASSSRADFNTMFLDYETTGSQRRLWLGATDYGVGGAVFQLNLVNEDIPATASLIRTKTPPGKSVNGLVRSADWLYATAGRTAGGVFALNVNNNLAIDTVHEFTNAKYAAASGNDPGSKHVVLKSGDNAEILVYEVGPVHTLLNTFPIGSIQPENGKSGIFVKDNTVWVSMGHNGLKAFDLNTGALVHSLSPSNMSDESITNGVALDDDYVYVANGSGGMYLCRIVPGQEELEILGVYWYGASANYITAADGYIFIANGREGLKILKKGAPGDYSVICDYDNQGLPECLEPNLDPLCPDLLSHISTALPENQNALNAHPEFFANPNRNLVLTAPATVYVTFIDEGANWRNSLGVYNYDNATPPSSILDFVATKMLVYPNASKQGFGGSLLPGNFIQLLGNYPAGTSIGAFLIADGWQGISPAYPTGLSEGYYTHYTDKAFNQTAGTQQSLLFYDAGCDAIILTFEDILTTSGGDKDFNDCIFKIIVDPPTAVNTAILNQL
ncbi:MAG TPA: hypothetical protein DCR43_02305 [Bacteroidales bacterium]|nr:MAG: hypothetical protein A2X11_07585 [Bacteroidetes bacterium GWE2_42_24]OFY29482.1 MAG: hypothetical protein A2X09_04015 [Bacteroidetes bacterium GWF2_43_11]PKP27798.1 MAG: hypothetical protein CVU06_00995 [Bacteroidetes bacterium HGW-Bacteroidetes-22]HAQ64681.1 hypothetical protein [Bacteroidales bacterium]HBZ67276.1 hypothetical protein [Bacteroidales bacterium]